ncbi:hypothetical protein ACFQX4_20810 [Roseomonas sp. GCM10028921]
MRALAILGLAGLLALPAQAEDARCAAFRDDPTWRETFWRLPSALQVD